MSNMQSFISPRDDAWVRIGFLPGLELLPLAQPVRRERTAP
jgi:hypothetical protein